MTDKKNIPYGFRIERVGDEVTMAGEFGGEHVEGSMPFSTAQQIGAALVAASIGVGPDTLAVNVRGSIDVDLLEAVVADKRDGLKVFERAVATKTEATPPTQTTIPLADNGGAMVLEKRETVKLPNLAVDAGKAGDGAVDDNVARWKHACDIGALTVAEVEYLKAQGVDVK